MVREKPYVILAIDDAKDSLMLLDFDLSESGYQVISAESGEDALTQLNSQHADLILLDMHMPGMSGLVLLEKLKADPQLKNIPVIMLSASDQEDSIVSALELGADDYVTKPYIPRVLLARIRNALRFMEKTKQLELLAKTDSLTQLNNRGSFQELTSAVISQAKRTHHPVSVAMFDLDFFKRVNDTYGHEAGDLALVEFAGILNDSFRDYDIVGRIGGEEFAVCMPSTTIEEAYLACERCRMKLDKHVMAITHDGTLSEFKLTVSIGITAENNQTMNFDQLLRRADDALYQAKQNGRNQSMLDVNAHNDNDSAPQTEAFIDDVDDEPKMNEEQQYPGIDYQVGVNNVLGDGALFEEILVMFYQDHGKDKEKINQAITNDDQASIKSLVHTLKGVACSIGAMNLFEYCKTLDVAVNNQQSSDYQQLFLPVAQELDNVIQGIVEKLSDKL